MTGPSLTRDGLIVAAPLADDEALHWWRIADGRVAASGQDVDPRAAAGLDDDGPDPSRIVALLPPASTRIIWASFDGLTPLQAEVAARMAATSASIGGADANHAVAVAEQSADPQPTVAAVIDKGVLAAMLARLQALGLDPDAIVPSAMLVPEPDLPVRMAIGGEILLRGPGLAAAYDPELAGLLVSGPIEDQPADALDPLLEASFAMPPLDMRQGLFAKRRRRSGLDAGQIRRLAMMFGALLLLSLLVEIVVLARTWIATASEDRAAVAELQKAVPGTADLVSGERRLDALLAAKGLGGSSFTVPASALFAAMQATPGVAVRSIDYRADGTLGTTLFAPSSDAINAVLLALQARGYVVTANPRQDSTGSVVADITVRG